MCVPGAADRQGADEAQTVEEGDAVLLMLSLSARVGVWWCVRFVVCVVLTSTQSTGTRAAVLCRVVKCDLCVSVCVAVRYEART